MILDTALLDYVTLTTFHPPIMDDWKLQLAKMATVVSTWKTGVRWLQYEGARAEFDDGSIFVGFGRQGKAKRKHAVLMVSGVAANGIFYHSGDEVFGNLLKNFTPPMGEERIRCTRIDLQVTVYDKEVLIAGSNHYSQGQIFEQVKDSGRTVSWMESGGRFGNLATVGINARVGEVYHRIYAKESVRGDVTRLETEYKGGTAHRVYRALVTGDQTVGGLVRRQVEKCPSAIVNNLFSVVRNYEVGKIPPFVKSGLSSTESWLLATVLPSLGSVLLNSDHSSLIGQAFLDCVYPYTWDLNYDELRESVDEAVEGWYKREFSGGEEE